MLVSSNSNKIINFQCSDRILQVNLHQLKHQSKTVFNMDFQIIGYRTTVFRGSQAKGCFCMKRCVWPLSIWHETWRQSLAKHDSNVTWKIGPIFIVRSRRNPFKKSFKKFTNLGLSPALLLRRTKKLVNFNSNNIWSERIRIFKGLNARIFPFTIAVYVKVAG